MSEHIDALVLIGLGSRIVADVPRYVHEDTEQGLYSIYQGSRQWYDGRSITETEKNNLYASEVFLKLGRLTAGICLGEPITFIRNQNILKFPAIEAIQNLSPLADGQTLNLPVEMNYWSSSMTVNGLPELFGAALKQDLSIRPELVSKWALARKIHTKRGNIKIPGYNINELADGIGRLKMDEIAPTDITGTTYDVADLIDHTRVKARLMDFPYYTTFNELTNATQMLYSAFEDLTQLSRVIK
ncbi:MAG TPA: hypothetical protein VIM37_01125 [Candidatus Microsaccharimonas sp.]|jgi:hypothetical protein